MKDNDTVLTDTHGSPVDSQLKAGFIPILVTTFTTVFVAELGDKTQIATLLLSAQSGKPIIVFIGASLALICSSLVAVLLGRWIAKSMPAERFDLMAGILMIGLGIWLGIQATESILKNIGSS